MALVASPGGERSSRNRRPQPVGLGEDSTTRATRQSRASTGERVATADGEVAYRRLHHELPPLR